MEVLRSYYDEALSRHGDTAQGAAWPNEPDRQRRFDVMLDAIETSSDVVSLCDVACGTGELYRRIVESRRGSIDYTGLDVSSQATAMGQAKFPGVRFMTGDVRSLSAADRRALASDYFVICGLFTVKCSCSDDDMWIFLTETIRSIWPLVGRRLAFNVMSAVVDWRRQDLFHVEMDKLAAFLFDLAGRRVQFRSDYGLYEYTAYVSKG